MNSRVSEVIIFMENLLINPWVEGTGVAVIGGLVLYHFFGIGKPQKRAVTHDSPSVTAGGNITAGGDIIVGAKAAVKKGIKPSYTNKKIVFKVTDSEPQQISLPINTTNFKKIHSQISLINAENMKWRVGYRFVKELNPRQEYVFHVFQDPGSNAFHSKIVVLENSGERKPDIQKHHIGIQDTKNFQLDLEMKSDQLFFYVDRIFLGKYAVPLQEISDLVIGAWSHGNTEPITIIVENIKAW